MTEPAVLTVVFFCIALLSAMVGHAGASAYLATMVIAGMAPAEMRPIALLLNIVVASIATIIYLRRGCFSWNVFWPFAASSIPCAFLGGALPVHGVIYKILVGLALVFTALRFSFSTQKIQAGSALCRAPSRLTALLIGSGLGLLSGITGIGGGVFLSPVLLTCRWSAPRITSGIAAAFILLNSTAGLLGHSFATHSLPPHIGLWALIVTCGGCLGATLGSGSLPGRQIYYALSVLLLIAGIKLMVLEPCP
ncbi:MAG: sulfite exporter TauE/SafE family protein [Candidatus Omnitrophica bacterium]|nr:sulfite exporter TauE/SafE family protein [Candidatus Omnitrophota bacterium]